MKQNSNASRMWAKHYDFVCCWFHLFSSSCQYHLSISLPKHVQRPACLSSAGKIAMVDGNAQKFSYQEKH